MGRFKPKSVKEEVVFVRAAVAGSTQEEELRSYLEPLVKKIIERYVDDAISAEELRSVAWESFPLALKNYQEELRSSKNEGAPYKFSTYFSWHVKQSIETHLGIAE